MSKAGYEVILIAKIKEENTCDLVRIIPFPEFNNKLTRFIFAPILIGWKAYKVKADIYQFHDPELILIGVLLKLLTRKPVIFDIHEDNVTVIENRNYVTALFKPCLKKIYLLFELISRKYLVVLIAEKYYKERIPEGVEILNYPILLETQKKAFIEKSPISSQANNWLLYTGSTRKDRGALHHANITSYLPDIGVYSAGKCSADLYEKMKNVSDPERLIVEGNNSINISRERLDYLTSNYKWLAGLALFPKTKHFEKKELTKFFEYMRDGIPILCSNMPAWEEFVTRNNVGIAVDPEDEEQIVRAIQWLTGHPDRRRVMGQNGIRLIKKKYNWQNEENKLISLYEKLDRQTLG